MIIIIIFILSFYLALLPLLLFFHTPYLPLHKWQYRGMGAFASPPKKCFYLNCPHPLKCIYLFIILIFQRGSKYLVFPYSPPFSVVGVLPRPIHRNHQHPLPSLKCRQWQYRCIHGVQCDWEHFCRSSSNSNTDLQCTVHGGKIPD